MKVKDIEWKELHYSENILYSYDFEGGRLTILDRETGWEFRSRDIETGYKDSQGKFWLASGAMMFETTQNLLFKKLLLLLSTLLILVLESKYV